MNRISAALFTVALSMIFMTSCKETEIEEVVSEGTQVVTSETLELNDQEFGIYYGDRYRNSTGIYSIVLSNGICYKEGNGEPYLDSQGDMLVLELAGSVLPENVPLNLPAGRYAAGETKSGSQSINLNSSYVLRMEGHTQSRYDIKSGALSVVRTSDGGYDIVSEDMVLTKNGVDIPVKYSFYGNLAIADYEVLAPTLVTVTDDIIDMPFADIVALYYGNLYGYGTANYVVTLYTRDFSENVSDRPGMLLTINMFSDLISGDEQIGLEPGRYNVKATFDATEFSVLYGLTMSSSAGAAYAFGSYLYQVDASGGSVIDYISAGTVDVAVSEDGIYTIDYDFTTVSSRQIKGTWEGPIDYSNVATDDQRVVLSTLEGDVECDLSKVESGSLKHIETLETTEMEPKPITEAWQLTLQPRDFTAEEKKLPWEERIEVYCPDGDAMTIEFMLPLDADGNVAPVKNKVYEYAIQPDLALTDYDYQLVTSKMGRPYDDIYDPAQGDMYYFMKGYDYCNSRRGFTWDGGYRGVWYFHYKEKHWLNLDEHAPAIRGTVKVKSLTDPKNQGGNKVVDMYLEWDLIDDSDAANKITGSWTGPVTIYR